MGAMKVYLEAVYKGWTVLVYRKEDGSCWLEGGPGGDIFFRRELAVHASGNLGMTAFHLHEYKRLALEEIHGYDFKWEMK